MLFDFTSLLRFKFRQFIHVREVRLLNLLPGYGFESIKCHLFHVPLDSAPDYNAVSYSWGTGKRTRSIHCNGGRLLVTEELHALLQGFRRQSSAVTLWIDQISVNQDDVAERGDQVQLAGEIYARATKVLIWLGSANKSSRVAMHLARRVLEAMETHLEVEVNLENLDLLRLPHWNHPDWKDVGSLLGRNWFRRTWTIQETVMSARVLIICGNDELGWNQFVKLIRAIRFAPGLRTVGNGEISTPPIVSHILELAKCREMWKNRQRQSLADLIIKFRSSEASDPRDKVYALLGLGDQDIKPDYSKPVEQIFIETASKIISKMLPNRTNGYSLSKKHWRAAMGLILSAGVSHQELVLPSWVPDWSVNPVSKPFWKDMQLGYRAGGNFVGTVEVLDGNKLQVYGRMFDRIISITEALEYDKLSGEISLQNAVADWFEAARSRVAQLPKIYPTTENTIDAFKATIIANRVPVGDIYRSASGEDRENYYHSFDFLHDVRMSQWEGIRFLPEATNSQYLQRILFETNGRSFFITQKGYMGLASKGAQLGDWVSLIGGASVPVLLRPYGREHKLVTECYVHGLMRDTVPMQDVIEQPIILV